MEGLVQPNCFLRKRWKCSLWCVLLSRFHGLQLFDHHSFMVFGHEWLLRNLLCLPDSIWAYHISKFVLMQAHSKNISILINAEKRREGLNELLDLADYAICSTNFPQVRVSSEHFCNLRIHWFIYMLWCEY